MEVKLANTVNNVLTREVLDYLVKAGLGKDIPGIGQVNAVRINPTKLRAKADLPEFAEVRNLLLVEADAQDRIVGHITRATVRLDLSGSLEGNVSIAVDPYAGGRMQFQEIMVTLGTKAAETEEKVEKVSEEALTPES